MPNTKILSRFFPSIKDVTAINNVLYFPAQALGRELYGSSATYAIRTWCPNKVSHSIQRTFKNGRSIQTVNTAIDMIPLQDVQMLIANSSHPSKADILMALAEETSNLVRIFHTEILQETRWILLGGMPYAYGVDVARALKFRYPSEAIKNNCRNAKLVSVPHANSPGSTRMNLIPLSDVFRLFIRAADSSVDPEIKLLAAEFESLIFDTILPTFFFIGASPNLSALKREENELIHSIAKLKEEKYGLILATPNTSYRKMLERMSGNAFTTTEIAITYGYKAKDFNEILQNLGIQVKRYDVWTLQNTYEGHEYTTIQTLNRGTKAISFMMWTKKGRLFLYDFLKTNGITPLDDK